MDFEWDPLKAVKNLEKHGVSFNEGATVLADPLALTYFDPDHSEEEERYLTFGQSSQGRILVVAHADRENQVRIISVRRATPKEKKAYAEQSQIP